MKSPVVGWLDDFDKILLAAPPHTVVGLVDAKVRHTCRKPGGGFEKMYLSNEINKNKLDFGVFG